MRRILLTFALAGLLAPAARADSNETAGEAARATAAQQSVEQLIADLGSEKYAVRRRAEDQLLAMGAEAFDDLKSAENSPDLEIAERARYIVQKMHVQWVRPDDPAEVRRLLARYGDLSVDARAQRVRQLAKLPGHVGLPAVCRVARFDQSPQVARRAALAILALDLAAQERYAAAASWKRELGASERPPAQWIRLYLRELDDPKATIAQWSAANAAEAALVKERSTDADPAVLKALLGRHLNQCDKLHLVTETVDALFALIDLTNNVTPDGQDGEQRAARLEVSLRGAVRWVIDHKRWDVLEPLEDRFAGNFRQSRILLYYLAVAADRAGRADRATELADRAFAMDSASAASKDNEQRIRIAKAVAEFGNIAWAEREYRRIIETLPVLSVPSMEARSDLAMWMHDREDFKGAAAVLGEFCDAIDADKNAKAKLLEEINDSATSSSESLREMAARRDFYLACEDAAREDYVKQRERLDSAVRKYDRDPDILIAMYHSPGADEQYQAKVRTRIRALSNYMQTLIDEYPQAPTVYNQWAWLIANTEGNQEKAVAYSKKSLQLAPEEPSYLDTLGRCYFAVGEYEKAVESQRRAVELAPQYGVMKRQLATFEKTVAEKGPRDPNRKAPPSDESEADGAKGAKEGDDSQLAPIPFDDVPADADPFGAN